MPEVSIILPCYNAVEYLPRALASIEHQTYGDFEVIVVDDGSTDAQTLQYLKSLPPHVKVVRQRNKGLGAARNTGFRHASGRYVLPLDCDDFIAPEFLAKSVQAIKSSGKDVYVFSHIALCGEKTGILKRNYNFFEQLFLNHLPYCLLIPKALWQQVGGYDEAMPVMGSEDWEFNIRLASRGYYGVVLNEPLFYYNVSQSGMLNSVTNNNYAQIWHYIQKKHSALYTWQAIFREWRHWREQPRTYSAALYLSLLLLSKTLPRNFFNRAFRIMMLFSRVSRV